MYVYVACLSESFDYVPAELGSTTNGTTTLQHTGHINAHYIIYNLFDLYFKKLR
jgi:hypothetical protein